MRCARKRAAPARPHNRLPSGPRSQTSTSSGPGHPFGRARDTVVLPEGWYLTANSIPGVIDETDDVRVRIRYVNGRPDQIRVFIKGKRR